jgi:hypothetical protein
MVSADAASLDPVPLTPVNQLLLMHHQAKPEAIAPTENPKFLIILSNKSYQKIH